MAVAFDAVGPSSSGQVWTTASTTWTHVCGASATALVVIVSVDNVATAGTWTVTYNSVAMTQVDEWPSGGTGQSAGVIAVFKLQNPATGSNTVSVANTGGATQQQHGGSVSLTGSGSFGISVHSDSGGVNATSGTITVASTTSGGLVIAGITNGSDTTSFTAGTSRFSTTQAGTGAAEDAAAATIASTGAGTSVTWTQTNDFYAAIALEVLPLVVAAAPEPPAPSPQLPPGWFPGADAVTAQPGGIPFLVQPAPADPSLYIAPPPVLPFPPWPPQPLPQLPPGWFPGADAVTTEPGGTPFYIQPGPADPVQAVPVPPPAPPYPPYTPIAPYWFPGASQQTAAPDGIPFWIQPQPDSSVSLPSAPALPYIAGASADGTHFIDQYGNPRLFVNEDAWYLICSAGRFSGDYKADIRGYMSARAAQGYTAVEVSVWSFNDGSSQQAFSDGRDFDGTWPFNTTNNPTSGFNEVFWARRDYLFATAAAHGMTVVLSVTGSVGTVSANNPMAWNMTTAQYSAYGTALGNRYKATPNILWIMGDEIPVDLDTQLTAFITALRAAGDTHLLTIQNGYPTTSRQSLPGGGPPASGIGPIYAQYNWVYDYNEPYNGVIPAMAEPVSLATTTIPVIWGDGFYLDQGTTGTTSQHLERNNWWWSLSSGACGVASGDGNVYEMPSGFLAYITGGGAPAGNFYTVQVPALTAAFTSLAGWQNLKPDAAGTLVTAGRGTFVAAGNPTYYGSDTDPYITVAWVPDGSLAVIYFPNGGTITVDQTKLGAGYTAKWMDPATGTTAGTTTGSTYTATGRPANSQGDEDWVLVLQGPPVTVPGAGFPAWLPQPPGWFPGSAAVTAEPGGIPFCVQPQPTDQNASTAAPAVTVNAGLAAGTGAALSTAVEVDAASTGLVTGTGAAQSPQSGIGAAAGLAAGTGVALAPATSSTIPLAPGWPAVPLPPAWFPGADTVITQPGGIPFLIQPQPADPVISPTTAVSAAAGLAAGTGTAQSPLAAIGVNAGLAAGTGTAQSPLAAAAVNTGLASGTGTAQPPLAAISASDATGPASGTGTAQSPVAAIAVNDTAGPASGTGTALSPLTSATAIPGPGYPAVLLGPGWFPGADVLAAEPGGTPFWAVPQPADPVTIITVPAVTAPAGLATGTGTAQSPVIAIGANDATGPASGTGTAQAPLAAAGVNAGLAAGTGTAQSSLAAIGVNAGLAAGTGTAQSPLAAAAVNTGLASGTGTAQPPLAAIGVNAGLASGTGTALSPVPAVAVNDAAGPALGTGIAQPVSTAVLALPAPGYPAVQLAPGWFPGADQAVAVPDGIPFTPLILPADPSFSVAPPATANAGLASGAGAVQSPQAAVGASTGLATGTGTVQPPVPAIGASAGLATGTGTALSAQGLGTGLPAGAGAAQSPLAALGVNAGLASGTGAAFTVAPARTPGLAAGTGTALAASLAVAANAQAATALGAALQPVASAAAAVIKGYSTATSVTEAAGMTATVTEAASCRSGVS